jgi:hypothetical protein
MSALMHLCAKLTLFGPVTHSLLVCIHCNGAQVEWLVMRAMSLGLVKGIMDEVCIRSYYTIIHKN